MKLLAALLVFSTLTLGGGCQDSKLSFSTHSNSKIPTSSKLIHQGAQYAGFDASYGFVFEVSDDRLQHQLIKEWGLESASGGGSRFFKFAKQEWWPTDEALSKMEINFSRTDEANEEYWQVWYDQKSHQLYIEHGWW